VVHRGHEYIQNEALERASADGLLIQPVSAAGKSGDFLPEVVLSSYRAAILADAYPKDSTVLGTFASWPRFAGPREAVFCAMVRRNMGCLHFIIGRDHAGVGDFYKPDAAKELIEEIGDIGIVPIFFDSVAFDQRTGRYVEGKDGGTHKLSGTVLRDYVASGTELPDWLVRGEVADVLMQRAASREGLFVQ
jgi:ATP sulfurylase